MNAADTPSSQAPLTGRPTWLALQKHAGTMANAHLRELFSADANLLATLADGTILVVKIGSTTFDNVTRAIQSLCENNVLGIVANGARASELYSKYTYYYSKAE